jgi:2'-5' RNA ligase
MRLFLAIELDECVKDTLCAYQTSLKQMGAHGRFVRRENMHLTLVFLGETGRVREIRSAMDAVKEHPFPLRTGDLGRFRRSGGDILWVGTRPDEALIRVQGTLCRELAKRGFQIEDRSYTPHLTIGREVTDASIEAVVKSNATMQVQAISLMKSERIDGKLVYTRVAQRELV